MLRWRLSLGVLLVAAFGLLLWLDHRSQWPGAWLFPLALLAAALGTLEVLNLMPSGQIRPSRSVTLAATLLVVLASAIPIWRPNAIGAPASALLGIGLAVLLIFAEAMLRYRAPGGVIERIALSAFAVLYVGLSLGFVILLRGVDGGREGVPAIAALILVVKMCDIGAYTIGRLFGKHKMSPTISPGKTLEGGAGGILGAVLGAFLALVWPLPRIWDVGILRASDWGWVWFGLFVGLAGMFGDLAESLLKRNAGRKDSSAWMPGFGGVLDVLDSILLAAPVAYACWTLGAR